jgi:hypothetical protein
MKVRHALLCATAAALVFVGSSEVPAQATGSLGCTSSSYFHQYTTYHGTICYTNTGRDDLSTSGFWTYKIASGSNSGTMEFTTTDGFPAILTFGPNYVKDFRDNLNLYPGGVVSVTALTLNSN